MKQKGANIAVLCPCACKVHPKHCIYRSTFVWTSCVTVPGSSNSVAVWICCVCTEQALLTVKLCLVNCLIRCPVQSCYHLPRSMQNVSPLPITYRVRTSLGPRTSVLNPIVSKQKKYTVDSLLNVRNKEQCKIVRSNPLWF